MVKTNFAFALLCAGFLSSIAGFASITNNDDHPASASQSVNPVIEWNKTLLLIVRTPGAQPPTIHSTRNFAMLHAAIFDAVNNIDRDFEPYAVRHPNVSRRASAEAAADQAAAASAKASRTDPTHPRLPRGAPRSTDRRNSLE